MTSSNFSNQHQETLLTLAKQGDVNAIQKSLNYVLQKLEVTARVLIEETVIELILEKAEGIPNQELTIKYIKNFFIYLQVPSLHCVIIYAKSSRTHSLAWSSRFNLRQVSVINSQKSTHSSVSIPTPSTSKKTEPQTAVLGTTIASVQTKTPQLVLFEQLPQSLQNRIRVAGSRKGEIRSWQEAKQMYEMMPENIRRQGVQSINQYKRTHDWSHKKAHSQGGSNHPSNGDWENSSINRARGSQNMTEAERKSVAQAKAKINFQAGKTIVLHQAVMAGGVAFGVEFAFSGLDNFLAVQRREKSVEEALTHTLANCTGVAVTSAVITGGVVALSLVFPPVAMVGSATVPFLQIVGTVAGVERLIGILSHSGKVDGMDKITALMTSYGIDETELEFRDLEVDAELHQMKLELGLV